MITSQKKWINAKIHSIKMITRSTWKFTLKFDSDFNYKPGQFITLQLRGISRNYSIASFSKNRNLIELIIVKVKDGKLTTLLFNDVFVGENLKVRGPIGDFVLPKEINRDFFFICTGTGLAPFKSILDEMQISKNYPKRIFLIFGTKTKKDILFFNEMKELTKSIPNFNYIPVLSRENWSGKTGYVHNQYDKIIKNEDLQNPLFYLCGWRNMIVDAKSRLKNLGIDSSNIKLELYG